MDEMKAKAKAKRQASNLNAVALGSEGFGKDISNTHSHTKPHTVKPWRLAFRGNAVAMNKEIWHWCLGDHYSGGTKYNGMYCLHDTAGHSAWRKEMDKNKSKRHAVPMTSAPLLLPTML